MIKGYLSLLFFIITSIGAEIYAQAPSMVFHQLTIEDGLSEGTVRTIIQDSRGYMWFGTEDGLNKYDGYTFTVYKNDPQDQYSITSNNIKCLYNDLEGRLWIGTRYGVSIYDHLLDRFYNFNSNNYTALKYLKGDVEKILQDKNGIFWVLTSTHGLYSFSSLNDYPVQYKRTTDDGIEAFFCMQMDAGENLWIGTYDGLIQFNTKEKRFVDYKERYGKGYQVRDIYVASKDYLWLATIEGLKRVNLTTNEVKSYRHRKGDYTSLNGDNTIRIWPGSQGIYLAIDGSGMDYFIPNEEKFYHYTKESGAQVSSNNITAIYKDKKGTLWLGTFLNGVNFTNDATNFFVMVKHNEAYHNSLKGGVVTSFLKDSKEKFWIGTDGGGLYVKHKKEKQFNNFREDTPNSPIASNAVISLLEDKEGNIWVSTYAGGLTKIKPTGDYEIFKNNPSNPHSLCFDKVKALEEYNNEIWISTYGMGLNVYNKETGKFRHYRHEPKFANSIASDWSYWMYVDSENTLWIATFEGLCRYYPEDDAFKTYRFNTQGSTVDQNYVFDIVEDSKGQLWLGTNGGGLIRFDPQQETFTSYTTKQGLSDNAVRTVVEDDENTLWLATNNGVSQFNLNTEKIEAYTINDGLPPCSFFFNSKYKDEQGKIYFGTNKGYLVITPSLANDKVAFPPVVLTALNIFNIPLAPDSSGLLSRHISEAKAIKLPYDKNTLVFEFAALNFNIPRHNFYAYQLQGFDDEWNYTGKNRVAKYTNLNPGKYIFKVKATNNEKEWGKEVTSFTVTIEPPFWATWWFRLTLAVLMLGSIVLFFFWRTQSIRRRNKWLQDEVQDRTQELEATNEELTIINEEISSKSEQILNQQQELLKRKQELEGNLYKLNQLTETQQTVMSVLAHDLRGPMQSITTLTEVLKKEHPEKTSEMAHLAATRLLRMAEDLLDWCVWSMDGSSPELNALDINKLVQEVIEDCKPSAGNRNISVHFRTDNNTQVLGNDRILSTAIRNILSNAVKYSSKGGDIEITIYDYKGCCYVSIKDEGIGMKPEHIESLLDVGKFRNKATGAGIGMTLSIDLLKKIEASVEINSIPEKGTEMKLRLPLEKTEGIPVQQEKVPMEPYKGKKLLLVEDDDSLRWSLMTSLGDTFELMEASSAEEALEILKKWQPDMCVLDITLPGIDGIELCRRIKADKHISHIGCIMLTGEKGVETNRAAFEAGAESYLNKPVELNVLKARIAGHFKNKSTYLQDYVLGQKKELVVEAPKQDQEFVQAMINCIEAHMSETGFGADQICEELGISRTVLYRKIKALTGQTVNDMIRVVRLRKAMKLLKEGKLNISQIAIEVGFNSLSYFTTSFKKHFGVSPSEVG